MTIPTRAQAEWAARVRAEYHSAALTARVLHLGIAVGLPREVLQQAGRVVQDELDHAELSHACMCAVGAADLPIALDLPTLLPPPGDVPPLQELLEHVVRSFCLGETLAVPLFRAMSQTTTQPTCRAALDRILRDEANHRALGWTLLDCLLDIDPAGVRAHVSALLPKTLAGFRRSYGCVPDGPPLTEDERSVGLLAPADYRRIFREAWQSDIEPRFVARNISTPPDALVGSE